MLNRLLISLLLLCTAVCLKAQDDPILSDDCPDVYNLGLAPTCPDTLYFTNDGATPSTISTIPLQPTCWPSIGDDVWIQFDVPADGSIVDFTITITGLEDPQGNSGMVQPMVAAYRGECLDDELFQSFCDVGDPGTTVLEFDLLGVTPGLPIFLRIQDGLDAGAAPGSFQVCVDTLKPVNTIDEGGSTSCTGDLFDSGGPDGDYQSSENFVYTICPTTPSACIEFTLEYFNLEPGFGDFINFYDGDNTSAPLIASFDDGGGVCAPIQASSGCLTVEFVSDGTLEFEGFAGSWQCSTIPCTPPTTFDSDPNPDPGIIASSLTTGATVVTIDTIICEDGAYGTFAMAGNSGLGLDKGLVLTSGQIAGISGPAEGLAVSNSNDLPGDADLDSLTVIGGGDPFLQESNDACIVEVDVFVAADELQFEYVFGSEEYPEFVGTSFNDIFALLISGPGIAGTPGLSGQVNMAVLPDMAATPVQINSVNNETNWEYYRNNSNSQTIAYDGLTSDFLGAKKSLTAAFPVTPCETYHLKFAIADRGDFILDSGVFIGEIKGGAPDVGLQSQTGLPFLIEECTGDQDSIAFIVEGEFDEEVTYQVIIGGSAEQDIDYTTDLVNGQTITFIPDSVTDAKFSVVPIDDMDDEGTDTITVTLTREFSCGVFDILTYELLILDEPLVRIGTPGIPEVDTAIFCAGGDLQLVASGTEAYTWAPADAVDPTNVFNPNVTLDSSAWVTVTGFFLDPDLPATCTRSDSIFIEYLDPQLTIAPLSDTVICEGDTLQLEAINNVGDEGLSWTPTFNIISDTDIPVIEAIPTFSTTFTATANVNGCVATDNIFIEVDFIDPALVIPTDTLICQGTSIQLAQEFFFTSSTYSWSPAGSLDDPTSDAPIASPATSTNYQVITTGPDSVCFDTQTVQVNVIPAEVDLPNQIFLCLGDTATIQASTTTGNISWTPNQNISALDELTVQVWPSQTTKYFATTQVGTCNPIDSITVRVDSLPFQGLEVEAFPFKEVYCPGDTVGVFISNPFDNLGFLDMEHEWSPSLDIVGDPNTLNVVIAPTETQTYTRITTNNACADTISFELLYNDPGPLEVVPLDSSLCVGESLGFQVLESTDPGTLNWSPSNDLSCSDCEDPTFTASNEGVQTLVVSGEDQGCPTSNTITLQVGPGGRSLNAGPEDTIICLGEPLALQVFETVDPGSISWTPATDLSCNDCPDPIATLTAGGDYSFTVTASIVDCPIEKTLNARVVDPSVLDLFPGDTSICFGDEFSFDIFTPVDPGSISWSPSDELSCNDCPDPAFNPADTGSTTFTVSTSEGGCPRTQTFTVNVLPSIDVFIMAEPDELELPAGEAFVLELDVEPDQGLPAIWTLNGDTLDQTEYVLEQTLTDTGFFTYVAKVVNAFGCSGMDMYSLEIVGPNIGFPNVFTPNGDQQNDVFRAVYSGIYPSYNLKIISRWGETVFESNDIDEGWDGTSDGKALPQDVYIYSVELQRPNGSSFVIRGDVTLIR